VDEAQIEMVYKRARHDKEARLATVTVNCCTTLAVAVSVVCLMYMMVSNECCTTLAVAVSVVCLMYMMVSNECCCTTLAVAVSVVCLMYMMVSNECCCDDLCRPAERVGRSSGSRSVATLWPARRIRRRRNRRPLPWSNTRSRPPRARGHSTTGRYCLPLVTY
jgi:hypothetical protein